MEGLFYKDQQIKVIHQRDENYAPYPMHTHNCVELYCILDGKVTFYIEGTRYPLSPGDILLMRPGEAHYLDIDSTVPYERIVVSFDTGVLEELEPGSILLQPCFDRKAGTRNLYTAEPVCTGYLLAMTEPDSSRATILANLILLLQRLCRRFCQPIEQVTTPDSVERRMIRYINQNLNHTLSVEELCQQFYLSRPQLCRRFRAATGTSIGRYIAVKRMLLARQLLLRGQKPTQVYASCGYRDYATFFRAYKSYFGHSPREATGLPITDERHIIE